MSFHICAIELYGKQRKTLPQLHALLFLRKKVEPHIQENIYAPPNHVDAPDT